MKFEACNIGCNNEDENFYTLKAIDLKENIKIWRSSLTLQELFFGEIEPKKFDIFYAKKMGQNGP